MSQTRACRDPTQRYTCQQVALINMFRGQHYSHCANHITHTPAIMALKQCKIIFSDPEKSASKINFS